MTSQPTQRPTSPGVSMTTRNPRGHRPVCAGCSTTLAEHCQTCGTCPGKPCNSMCADMKAAEAAIAKTIRQYNRGE
jgi:hypothetical protein